MLVLFRTSPDVLYFLHIRIQVFLESLAPLVCILLQVFHEFGPLLIFGIVQDHQLDMLHWVMLP